MNNLDKLLQDLPDHLQDKITRMNPHPLHKIVNDAFNEEIDYYNSHYHYNGYEIMDETDYYFENYKNAKLWYRAMNTRKMTGFTPDYVEMLLRDEYHHNNNNESDDSEDGHQMNYNNYSDDDEDEQSDTIDV